IGYLASLAVSLLTIFGAGCILRQAAPAALLAGQTEASSVPTIGHRARGSRWIAGLAAAFGLVFFGGGGFVQDHEMQAATFFGGGALLLTAGLAALWAVLSRADSSADVRIASSAQLRIASLGARNAGRHPSRSLLTAGLIASSAFLIVAVESFR